MSTKKGFTLIEIMVAMMIVAILSLIAYSTFAGTQAKARDLVRKEDLQNLQLALKIYKQKTGFYPVTSTSPSTSNMNDWVSSDTSGWNSILGVLVTGGEISGLPVDSENNCGHVWDISPTGGPCYTYSYWSGETTNSGYFNSPCPQGFGKVFILVTRLENSNDANGAGNGSTQLSCDGGLLQTEIFKTLDSNTYVVIGT